MLERPDNVVALPARERIQELGQRSDDELMALCSAGLVAAFDEILVRHQRALRAFCARMLGSHELGDDAAQEVCLQLWRTRSRYQPRDRFRSFLFTAARNRCLSELRQHRGERSPELPVPGDPAGALDQLLAEERRRQLLQLVDRLPAKLREIVWLRYAAELDYGEIAAIVERPVETVRSRMFLALRRLRRLQVRERS